MADGTPTPLSDEAIRQYPVFTEGVHARLIAGRETYGDSSFERPVAELLDELQQECMDLSGWGFILWGKIEKMKLAARATHKAVPVAVPAEGWLCTCGCSIQNHPKSGPCVCEACYHRNSGEVRCSGFTDAHVSAEWSSSPDRLPGCQPKPKN